MFNNKLHQFYAIHDPFPVVQINWFGLYGHYTAAYPEQVAQVVS